MEYEYAPVDRPCEVANEQQQEETRLGLWQRFKNRLGAYHEAAHDEEIRGCFKAVGRTAVNAAIVVADIFPVAGDGVSWSADVAKVAARVGMLSHRFDLTPDVNSAVAVGSEGLEFFGLGFTPTHAFEATWQLKHDAKRIQSGRQRWQQIKTNRNS